jgi:hypothetical protein
MISLRPIETRSLYQKYFGFVQKILNEGLIVIDGIHVPVKLGEHVEGCMWFDTTHSRNLRQ